MMLQEHERGQVDILPDIVDSLTQTAGQLLKKSLGLEKIRYVWIQKVLNMSYPIYIITYNSRRPGQYLSPVHVKKMQSSSVGKIKRHGITFINKKVKTTPPILIDHSLITLQTGYIFVMRDYAGEYLRDDSLFESVVTNNKISFKEIKSEKI